MAEVLWLMAATVLGWVGMAWLALAMEVHWDQAMQRPAAQARSKRRTLRLFGALALLLSLLACLAADRPSMAFLVWVLLMAASALGIAMLLSRRPRWLARLVPGRDIPCTPA